MSPNNFVKQIKPIVILSFLSLIISLLGYYFEIIPDNSDRDLIIRLCLAGHFNWDETNRALKLYGLSELYAKDPRDACIIVAINNRIFDMYEIDEMLTEQGLDKLSEDEE